MMRQEMTITPSMKLADLIELNYKLLDVLSRLGIGLGFGERTIADACEAHNIGKSSFVLICNEYTFEGYVPSEELLMSANASDIMNYLHNSHLSYMDGEMERLRASLAVLLQPTDAGQKRVVENFFMEYRKEVKNHFDYEEFTAFPYVMGLMEGRAVTEAYSIGQFEKNHSNIEEKLEDLKNIVLKYLPEDCDSELAGRVLMQLFSLAEDLDIHTAIENNILVPVMNMIENNGAAV